MKINFKSLRLKRDFKRSKILHFSHFGFVLLFLIGRYFNNESGILLTTATIIITAIYYRFYYQTAQKLYYTFWTFSGILASYLLIQLFQSETNISYYSLLLALFFLGVEMYVLSSPIYYPIINWWDYDFRFRYDLKITPIINNKHCEGRLTDLRRGAGCITLFEDLDVGKRIDLDITLEGESFNAIVEIMSKRQHSLGRPFHYGVNFITTEQFGKKQFILLVSKWKQYKKHKRLQKHKELINNASA
jgi:hypothetical protein